MTDVLSRCNMLMLLELQTRSFTSVCVLVEQNESCDEISVSSREVNETEEN